MMLDYKNCRLIIFPFFFVISVAGARREAVRHPGGLHAAHGEGGRAAEPVARQRRERAQDRARVRPQVHGLRAGEAVHSRRRAQRHAGLRAPPRRLLRWRFLSVCDISTRGPLLPPNQRLKKQILVFFIF